MVAVGEWLVGEGYLLMMIFNRRMDEGAEQPRPDSHRYQVHE